MASALQMDFSLIKIIGKNNAILIVSLALILALAPVLLVIVIEVITTKWQSVDTVIAGKAQSTSEMEFATNSPTKRFNKQLIA